MGVTSVVRGTGECALEWGGVCSKGGELVYSWNGLEEGCLSDGERCFSNIVPRAVCVCGKGHGN